MISANIKENVTKQNCNIQHIFILIAVTNYWHDSNSQKSYFLFYNEERCSQPSVHKQTHAERVMLNDFSASVLQK
jgi:hypothetical protein